MRRAEHTHTYYYYVLLLLLLRTTAAATHGGVGGESRRREHVGPGPEQLEHDLEADADPAARDHADAPNSSNSGTTQTHLFGDR